MLKARRLRTLGALAALTRRDLMHTANIGRHSMAEIDARLAEHGLQSVLSVSHKRVYAHLPRDSEIAAAPPRHRV